MEGWGGGRESAEAQHSQGTGNHGLRAQTQGRQRSPFLQARG